jgi:hypothetical protein
VDSTAAVGILFHAAATLRSADDGAAPELLSLPPTGSIHTSCTAGLPIWYLR